MVKKHWSFEFTLEDRADAKMVMAIRAGSDLFINASRKNSRGIPRLYVRQESP
jgi:hypothetical protein